MFLTIEDEETMEISLNILILLLLVEIIIIAINRQALDYISVIFGSLSFFLIHLLTKGIGLGDVILNSILSLRFSSVLLYFKFFTLTFSIGAIYSIYSLVRGKLTLKSSVPFVKFIVIAYYLMKIKENIQWVII